MIKQHEELLEPEDGISSPEILAATCQSTHHNISKDIKSSSILL
jgi:hypothetical protein